MDTEPAPPDGRTAVDPVCEMTVDPANAPRSRAHGRDFFFCCEACRVKFDANPARYLAGGAAPPAVPGAAYVCPMDAEVLEHAPGPCPVCGMALEPRLATPGDGESPELAAMSKRFWVCLALALPVVVLDMLGRGRPLVDLALASPVVLWGGAPFFARAWTSVVRRSPNMFTLVALGSGAAFLYSVVATLAPRAFPPSMRDAGGAVATYFEASAVIVVLVLLGQVLELRARLRTGDALRALLVLAPKSARRVRDTGEEEDVDVAVLARGNRIRIRPGERIAVDGRVVEGSSACDESMVSGESMPVPRTIGDRVIGGTVNVGSPLLVEVVQTGEGTLLAQIGRMVADAQRSRAPIQALVDRVSRVFVPAVVATAAVTFGVWMVAGPEPRIAHALVNAVAVVIIACPCALGLATPMSVMVGVGRGAMAGVLVKNAEALDRLEAVDTLLLDKTGTLTVGRPEVVHVATFGAWTRGEVLGAAAALEVKSEHPLAAAIVRARGAGTPAKKGEGGRDENRGGGDRSRRRRASGSGKRQAPRASRRERDGDGQSLAWRREGETLVHVVLGKEHAATLGVADPPKETSREAVALLRAAGLRVIMLTGDHDVTARAVAALVGIDDVRSGVSPAEKADVVRTLRAAGHKVAVAGDGVNDAPALAEADVGIAMGTGTDVAIEAAGITLVRGDLRGILRARRLSVATMRNIRQNSRSLRLQPARRTVAAGALYPVFGVLLSPMIAAAAMSLSSVSVVDERAPAASRARLTRPRAPAAREGCKPLRICLSCAA